MTMTMLKARRGERGYNLIEVLIAMAILGVVLISIGTLFIFGRRNVYSGKQMTIATAIGNRVLEDLQPLTSQDVTVRSFDIADGTTGDSITYGSPPVTYANSAVRSTNPDAVAGYDDIELQAEDGPEYLTAWAAQLVEDVGGTPRERLNNGSITLIMTPASDTVATARFGNAALLRLRVIVQWREQKRVRQVILDTVKAN